MTEEDVTGSDGALGQQPSGVDSDRRGSHGVGDAVNNCKNNEDFRGGLERRCFAAKLTL